MNKERALIGKRYKLEREIGRGGMGIVYLATDLHLNRLVAIKVLPPQISADTQTFSRFKNEVFGISRLEHPSIIKVYDAGVQGSYYYVMQYVDGPNLYNETIRRKTFSLKDALPILRQIASALDYAHKKGFIHRDVKPENILLDSHYNAYLVDFGIVLSSYMPKRFTQGFIGTPEYASPEHCKNEPLTGASDQYSFAIIAHEMLVGRAPFERGEDGNPVPVIVSQLNDPPPDPRQFNPSLPEHVAKALLRAISKKPAERFSSCQEFVDILSAVTVPPESQFVSKAKNAASLSKEKSEPQKETPPVTPQPEVQVQPPPPPKAIPSMQHIEDLVSTPPSQKEQPQMEVRSQEKEKGSFPHEPSGKLPESSFKPLPPEPQQPVQLSENVTRHMVKGIGTPPAVKQIESQVTSSSDEERKKGSMVPVLIILFTMFIGIAGIGFYFYSQNMHNYGGRADKMMNASNYPQAITLYKKALLKNPADDAIMMKLANAYLLNKNFDEAAKQLDTVASAKPEKVEALKSTFISTYTAAAKNAEETSNGENAVLYYEKALAITPDDDTIIKSLASLYETQEKSDKAVELYERILKQKPEDMELGQKLATLHQKNGNIEKAIILYNNLATQNKSKAPEFYNTIGKLYLEQNNIQNALEYFKLSSDSGFTEANSGLAKIYLQKGNTEKAFGVLKTMVKSNPDEQTKQAFAETGYKLYSAALISRKTQDASSYLASLKAINPEFLEQKGNELINNGNSFAAQKKYQAALNEYKKAKPLTGESPALIFKMIDMNYKLKNYGEVKHLYSKAVALNKNDAEIQKQLKAMKAAIEKIERAAYIAPVRTQQTSQSIYIPQSHHRPSYIPPRHSAPAYRPQQEPSRPAPVYRPQPRPRKRFNPIQIPKVPSSEVEKGTVIDIPSSK